MGNICNPHEKETKNYEKNNNNNNENNINIDKNYKLSDSLV